jgi:aminoglycoside phosphotransferase (APT) family kinase protein
MECVSGRVLTDPRLPDASSGERAAIYDSMNDVLARLHRVDWKAVGLEGFGRTGSYITRQIHRWTQQYRASETERIEAMEHLIEWLPAHTPAHEDTTVVHGDFRLGNTIVHPEEPRIIAVLDWELATLGNPLSDLAYNAMPYRLEDESMEGFQGGELAGRGIPTEAEYVGAYCRRTGREAIEGWEFYLAFSMFRLAAIAQGIMGRVVAGTANDPQAIERGRRARPVAEAAWQLVKSALL